MQRLLPLDSVSSLFLLDVVTPKLLDFSCRFRLLLLEPSSTNLSDSLLKNKKKNVAKHDTFNSFTLFFLWNGLKRKQENEVLVNSTQLRLQMAPMKIQESILLSTNWTVFMCE